MDRADPRGLYNGTVEFSPIHVSRLRHSELMDEDLLKPAGAMVGTSHAEEVFKLLNNKGHAWRQQIEFFCWKMTPRM